MRTSSILGSVLVAALAVAAMVSGPPAQAVSPRRSTPPTPAPAPRAAPMPRMPLLFVENRGQVDAAARYYLRGRGETVWFTSSSVVFDLTDGRRGWAVAVDFVGARPDARPEGRDAAPTTMSWFRGAKADWITGVPTFRDVVYRDLWPGIDAVFTTGASRLKYRFEVRPGADPGAIRLASRGARDVSIDGAGRLVAQTALGDLVDDAPVSWQVVGGRSVDVATEYAIESVSARGVAYSLRVGAYDASLPLVVDPVVVLYAGYLGGDLGDDGAAIAVDTAGAAYVTGQTTSQTATFPSSVGPYTLKPGGVDAFVAKVAVDGMALDYVGYLGGTAFDAGLSIAVDSLGSAYVLGLTNSDQLSSAGKFPVLVGPDVTFNGDATDQDCFVAKVTPAGTGLVWCGYVGGSSAETGGAIAVDANGNAYVAGATFSTETMGFPLAVGPDLTFSPPGPTLATDAFVAKVRADGTGLAWCGYIGGVAEDRALAVAVDGTGHAYVAGNTSSPQSSFPVLVGPDLTHNGTVDAFVARVKSDGTALDWCGYVGGAKSDSGNAVAVDAAGNAYVGGTTLSDESSAPTSGGFPVKNGPDVTHNGEEDAFVGRVSLDGSGLEWCGYLGSEVGDCCYAIALGPTGTVFMAGATGGSSSALDNSPPFPVKDGPDLTYNGDADAYVAEVNASGTGLVYAGYVGGTRFDVAYGLAVDGLGNACIVGSTSGGLPSVVGPDATFNSSSQSWNDAFVAKVSAASGGAGPAPINGYLLPSKVAAKFNAKNPAKSVLTMTGAFDLGGMEPCVREPSTLDVGGLHFDIPALTERGKICSYKAPAGGLSFTVVLPAAGGSSKAAFTVKYVGDLVGKVDPDGQLALHFVQNAGRADALVTLAKGAFSLGKRVGRLIEPCVFIARSTAKLKGAGKDSLSLTIGLALDGLTPPARQDFMLRFGDALTVDIPAGQFVRRGAKDTFTGNVAGITTVVVDYAHETITASGKGLSLGQFGMGGNVLAIGTALGGDLHTIEVVLSRKGSTLSY